MEITEPAFLLCCSPGISLLSLCHITHFNKKILDWKSARQGKNTVSDIRDQTRFESHLCHSSAVSKRTSASLGLKEEKAFQGVETNVCWGQAPWSPVSVLWV